MRLRSVVELTVLVAAVVAPCRALAEEPTKAVAPKPADESAEWLLPSYEIEFGDADDWLQLTTGEWLRGNLRWMQAKGIEAGENVKFYSDQFNDTVISWSYVARFRSPKANTYVFLDKVKLVGPAVVTPDSVTVGTKDGPKTLPRSQLVSIIRGEQRERSWWSTAFSLGFAANAGNSNQGSLNTTWKLERADGRTLAGLGYNGTVGWAAGSLNTNRHLINFDVNLFFWRKFYLIPVVGQLLHDSFQNLGLRATPAAGAGVHLFRKQKHRRGHANSFEWDLQSGLGYQFTRLLSAASGVQNAQSDGFVMFRTYWQLKFINGNVEVEVDWRSNWVYTTIGNTNHSLSTTVTIEMTDMIDFVPSFLFLRTEKPQPEADGTIPKKNDYQLVVSLALEFG